MNQRLSVPLALSALLGSLLAAGCLPDDPPVAGTLLYRGIHIEAPHFEIFEGEPWVLFDVRRAIPQGGLGGRLDLHRVRWTDGEHEVIVEGRSDNEYWNPRIELRTDAEGAVFYVIDEWLPKEGPRQSVGTLVRVRHAEGVIEAIPDVITYQLHASKEKFYYRKHLPGSPYSELHLRDLDGRDVNVGLLTRTVQFLGDALYFIGGPTHTLYRKEGFEGLPVPLRDQVSAVQIDQRERFALITVPGEENVTRTVFLDLETLKEKPLPVEKPCCGFALGGDTVTFAMAATPESPAELRTYNLLSEKYEKVVPMPVGLADVRGTVPRLGTSEFLVSDRNKQWGIVRPDDLARSTLLPIQPTVPSFSLDGRFLVYIDEEPPPPPPAISNSRDGTLMVQDADDWSSPPLRLSPVGTTCPITPRPGFFLAGDRREQAVFWARFGLGSSDLFLADLATGALVKIAPGIGAISITSASTILGVVRIGQDLTGDLVHRDFVTGQEAVIEHSVSDFAGGYSEELARRIVAFVVRERNASSPRNGLWAAPWKDLPDPGADPQEPVKMEGQGGTRGGASERPW